MTATLGMMFQSTPPAWGATYDVPFGFLPYWVSIHAPRVGGDFTSMSMLTSPFWFQSTPPAWGATYANIGTPVSWVFQSTPPAWGAT